MALTPQEIEAILAQRYGGPRFNPAAGQTTMSFEEWLDRHPALRGVPSRWSPDYERQMQERYAAATGAEGGQKYLERMAKKPGMANPAAPESMLAKLSQRNVMEQMGGPDTPPKTPVGGTWDEFVESHGGKPTARLAGLWRRANKMKLSPKMAKAVARRRVRGPGSESGSNKPQGERQ